MRIDSHFVLLLAIVVASNLPISPVNAIDTDGDGLLDLLDVLGFDPSATGTIRFDQHLVEDLDGANLLTRAQSLQLRGNRIASVKSGDFDGLTNLQDLGLGDNRIASIESGAFRGLTNLQDLELGDNQITSVESGGFDGLTNLQQLSLVHNRILNIENGDFDGLTNLQGLGLNSNRIRSLESGDFDGLTNLQDLQSEPQSAYERRERRLRRADQPEAT